MTMAGRKIRSYSPATVPSAVWLLPAGFAAGIINGLLGCGGGIITVLALTSLLPEAKDAAERTRRIFATTVVVVLPMSAASALVYGRYGLLSLSDMLPVMIPAAVGGALGGFLLDRINTQVLKKLFAVLMVYSGVRLIFGGGF